MSLSALFGLWPLLIGFAGVSPVSSSMTASSLSQSDELVLRVPVRPLPQPRIDWQPGRSFRCMPIRAIRGAMLSSPGSVDVLLPHQHRVRAHFAEDCPALDFYSGFYLKPQDAQLCAGRDIIYSRMGGSCRIEGFHLLVPRLKRQSP